MPLLSICITTRNRANQLTGTLERLLSNLPNDVEIVVVDGNSEDDTKSLLESLSLKSEKLSFSVQSENSGIDGGYSEAASLSRGKYIWFVSDDDEIRQDATQKVLESLKSKGPLDVLVINYSVWDKDLTEQILPSRIEQSPQQAFSRSEADDLFEIAGGAMTYLASTVISRQRWESIDPASFMGSYFVHVAAAFSTPFVHGAGLLLDPLIRVRGGVPSWRRQSAVIWLSRWPRLIQRLAGLSMDYRSYLKKSWEGSMPRSLLWQRALGNITLSNFKDIWAEMPNGIKNKLSLLISVVVSYRLLNYLMKVRVKNAIDAGRNLAWEAYELRMGKLS